MFGESFEIYYLPESAKIAFLEAYASRHKFIDKEAAIEAVDWYLVATINVDKRIERDSKRLSKSRAPNTSRKAYFPEADGWVNTQVLSRETLSLGHTVPGPAIVEDPDSTTVVPPGDTVELTTNGHLLIEIKVGE